MDVVRTRAAGSDMKLWFMIWTMPENIRRTRRTSDVRFWSGRGSIPLQTRVKRSEMIRDSSSREHKDRFKGRTNHTSRSHTNDFGGYRRYKPPHWAFVLVIVSGRIP